jgi:flagellar biosynthesis GTPase FlhF
MKQELAPERPMLYAELDRLSCLAMAAGKDFNDELTLILNRAVISLDLIGADHPAASDLIELQSSVARCAEITRCLMLLTLRARDSMHYVTLQ